MCVRVCVCVSGKEVSRKSNGKERYAAYHHLFESGISVYAMVNEDEA